MGLLDQTSQGFGSAAGALSGADPYSFMTQGAKQRQGQRDLSGLKVGTAQGMEDAANIYGKMGLTEKQVMMAQAAQAKMLQDKEAAEKRTFVETTAMKADKYGLTEDAVALRAGGVSDKSIEQINEKIRDIQLTEMAALKNGPARRGIAANLGIESEEFDSAGLGKASPEAFRDYVNGREASPEGYTDAAGKPVLLATNKTNAKVLDPADKKWKYAHEMGLTPNVQVSKIHNVSNRMVEELAMTGVENFDELHQSASDAQTTLDNINRNLPLIDDMPTGTFADMRVWMSRALDTLGIEQPKDYQNAEVFLADAGQRVAKEITAFGAGTGLSDKDLAFAEQMSAGKINVSGPALKRILNIRKQVAEGTIKNFDKVKKDVRASNPGPEMDMALSMYQIRAPQPRGVEALSPAARALLGDPSGTP